MIYVKKPPLSVDGFDAAAKKELKEYLQFISTNNNGSSFTFKVYKNPKIKESLVAVFQGKCAYCESEIQNHPEEVEHFRPKSRITDKNGIVIEPGYYWLAADWDNLLISCIDCNRKRTHTVPGETKKQNIGKQDQFPIDDEKKRWTKHTSRKGKEVENQYRLLIHPCEENPEKYFLYDENGLIIPSSQLQGLELAKATTSIRVYALQRMGLVNARKKYYLRMIKQALIDIANEKHMLQQETNPASIANRNQQISRKVKQLLDLTKPNEPYSAMAKCILKKELPDLLK